MNKDLHATHQIVSLLERSKTLTDRILDQIPGVFVTVDEDGTILRSNILISKILKLNHEDVLGKSCSLLFRPETWKIFLRYFLNVTEGRSKNLDFELPIDAIGTTRSYYWQVQNMEVRNPNGESENLFVIHGQDITELKSALGSLAVLGKNLELAKAVQNLILPKQNSFISDEIKLVSLYEPAEVTGGDFWWYEVEPGSRCKVLIGDVTGHGAGSAMVTSLVAGIVRALQGEAKRNGTDFKIENLFSTVHDSLLGLEGQPYWMTLTSLDIDFSKKVYQWRCAAAPPLFHQNKDGKIDLFVEMGNHLGSEKLKVGGGTVPFSKGDRLLLFTDGVFELQRPDGRTLGLRGIQKALEKSFGYEIMEARKIIESYIKNWRETNPLEDDLAFVLIEL